jgi:NhaA family Na+:H+ antiporter
VLEGAGVETLLHPVALGIALGLIVGKPLGIGVASYAACALFRQKAPARFPLMMGMTLLAGIGFTMSLFIGNLAFGTGELATPVRFGVLGGSFVAAVAGLVILYAFIRREEPKHRRLARDEEAAERAGVLEDIDEEESERAPR